MNERRLLAATLAAVVLVTALAPLGTVAAETGDELSVAVSQEEEPIVTVTQNGSAVANATVRVTTVDENATYAGDGEHATDENGTVALSAPEENVTVSVSASVGNSSAVVTTTLEAADDGEEEPKNFGAALTAFLESTDDERPHGTSIASFVVANNPGNAPDHAGPGDDDEDDRRGPPAHAGGSDENDDERGPPAHAGGDDGDSDDDDDDDVDEEDDEDAGADEDGTDA